jgi:hypothetical protein
MPILYMLKVSVYAGFMQIFSGTYCGLSLKIIIIVPKVPDYKDKKYLQFIHRTYLVCWNVIYLNSLKLSYTKK